MTKPTTAELLRDFIVALIPDHNLSGNEEEVVKAAADLVRAYRRTMMQLDAEDGIAPEPQQLSEPSGHGEAIQHLAEDALRSKQTDCSDKAGDILGSYPTAPGNHVVEIRSTTPVWITTHDTLEAAEQQKRWATAWSRIEEYLTWGGFDISDNKFFKDLNRAGLIRLSAALYSAMQAAQKPTDR